MKKDYNFLNYFNMRALFMGIGLSKILILTKEYFPYALLFGTLLGLLILHFVQIEQKKSFINIIVSIAIMIICFIVLTNMIATMYLTEMSKFMVGLPIVFLLLYILSKREIVILRLSSILIFFNILLYGISLLTLLQYVDWLNFSYTNTPIQNIFLGGLEYAVYSVVPIYLTRSSKYRDYSLLKTYIISSISMAVLFFLTYGILGSQLIELFRYPEYIIFKKITFFDATANIHNIISFIWIIDIFMLMLSCGNCIKNNLEHKKLIYIIIPIVLFVVTIINKHYVAIISNYHYSFFLLIGCFVALLLFNRRIHNQNKKS